MISFDDYLAEFEKTASQEYFDAKEKYAPYIEFEIQRLKRASDARKARLEKRAAERNVGLTNSDGKIKSA